MAFFTEKGKNNSNLYGTTKDPKYSKQSFSKTKLESSQFLISKPKTQSFNNHSSYGSALRTDTQTAGTEQRAHK